VRRGDWATQRPRVRQPGVLLVSSSGLGKVAQFA
jgi:hypothetical protein